MPATARQRFTRSNLIATVAALTAFGSAALPPFATADSPPELLSPSDQVALPYGIVPVFRAYLNDKPCEASLDIARSPELNSSGRLKNTIDTSEEPTCAGSAEAAERPLGVWFRYVFWNEGSEFWKRPETYYWQVQEFGHPPSSVRSFTITTPPPFIRPYGNRTNRLPSRSRLYAFKVRCLAGCDVRLKGRASARKDGRRIRLRNLDVSEARTVVVRPGRTSAIFFDGGDFDRAALSRAFRRFGSVRLTSTVTAEGRDRQRARESRTLVLRPHRKSEPKQMPR